MATLKFNCPTCLRKSIKTISSDVATEIKDLQCPVCKARWRFKITPSRFLGDGVIHKVENTVKL